MSGFVLKGVTRRRTEPLAALPEHSDQQRERILSNHVKQCTNLAEYVEEIDKLWSEAQDKFLSIGRYLVQAKLQLPHGQFEDMVATQLPFGKNVAYQLRCVALAVEQDRLDASTLPRSYNNAFRLAQMKSPLLERAREAKLIRPDVTRREIDDFLNVVASEVERSLPEADRIKREAAVLQTRIATLEDNLAAAKRRLAELLAQSNSDRFPVLPHNEPTPAATASPKLPPSRRR